MFHTFLISTRNSSFESAYSINVVDWQNVICSILAFCSQTSRFEGFLDGHKDAIMSIWVNLRNSQTVTMFAGFIFCKIARDEIIWGLVDLFIGALEFWHPLMDIDDTHRHCLNIFHLNLIPRCFIGSLSFCSIY